LGLLRRVERTIAILKPEHFIESAGERLEARARMFVERPVRQQNLAAPRADGEPAIGQSDETSGLDVNALGNRHIDDPVAGVLAPGRAPRVAQVLRRRGDQAQAEKKQKAK